MPISGKVPNMEFSAVTTAGWMMLLQQSMPNSKLILLGRSKSVSAICNPFRTSDCRMFGSFCMGKSDVIWSTTTAVIYAGGMVPVRGERMRFTKSELLGTWAPCISTIVVVLVIFLACKAFANLEVINETKEPVSMRALSFCWWPLASTVVTSLFEFGRQFWL